VRKGGLVFKYTSAAERQWAYRRRKAQVKLDARLVNGILNLETGRVRKWSNGAISINSKKSEEKQNLDVFSNYF